MISAALLHVRDILEPASNEQAKSAYLERQMRQMVSVKLPSGMPSLKDGMVPRPESLQDQIQSFCQERKDKRKKEWESHRVALEKIKKAKSSNAINKAKRKGMPCMLRYYRIWKEQELL